MKKLPPYGKHLAQKIIKGELPKNDIYLTIGVRAWEAAKVYALNQTVLLLPPDQSPYRYIWPVTNLPVLLIDTGNTTEQLIKQTAHALLSEEASIVRTILSSGSLVIFRR